MQPDVGNSREEELSFPFHATLHTSPPTHDELAPDHENGIMKLK